MRSATRFAPKTPISGSNAANSSPPTRAHHVPSAHKQPQGMSDGAQQRVAGSMTVSIVGRLQSINVQGKDGEWLPGDGAQSTIEFAPVFQTGEHIGGCQLGEFHGRLVERAFGANALEKAPNVMAGHGDSVERSPNGALSRFPKDDQYADHTAVRPDRKGQRTMDVRSQRLDIALSPSCDRDRRQRRSASRLDNTAHERRPRPESERPTDGIECNDLRGSIRRRVVQLDLPSITAAHPDLTDTAAQRRCHQVEARLKCPIQVIRFVK